MEASPVLGAKRLKHTSLNADYFARDVSHQEHSDDRDDHTDA
jgi:hypothetical protein